MNRRVCHACSGLPRSFFCNVCDTPAVEPEPFVEKYQYLDRGAHRAHPCWEDTNKDGYEYAMQCGIQVRRLIWTY